MIKKGLNRNINLDCLVYTILLEYYCFDISALFDILVETNKLN